MKIAICNMCLGERSERTDILKMFNKRYRLGTVNLKSFVGKVFL